MRKKEDVLQLPNAKAGAARANSNLATEMKAQKKDLIEKTVRTLLLDLNAKDNYTYGHSMRVAYYAIQLGREIGLDEEKLYDLELSALFHDVGKIGVPDAVLLKPSRLDDKEFLEMKLHPEKSAEILAGFPELN